MRLRLQNYYIRVEYQKGTTLYLANTLSRAYLNATAYVSHTSVAQTVRKRVFATEFEQLTHDEDLAVLPRKLKTIREETATDFELQLLIGFITNSWPDSRKETGKLDKASQRVVNSYWNSRDD